MLLSEATAGADLFRWAPLVIFLPLLGMLVNLALVAAWLGSFGIDSWSDGHY